MADECDADGKQKVRQGIKKHASISFDAQAQSSQSIIASDISPIAGNISERETKSFMPRA
jgi:hypothetical protein